jgi:hypothetical protein
MLGHESIDMTKEYLESNLDDEIGPMHRQDDWIRKVMKVTEKGPFEIS